MYESKYHVPIRILNNGYYGELDELIKSYDLGGFWIIEQFFSNWGT